MFKSEQQCLDLIEQYRKHECLWHPKNENYFKKPIKLDAWSEIAAVFELDPVEGPKICEKKIHSLLASYRREVGKEKKSRSRTGTGADEVYESRWFGIQALAFLRDRDKSRKRVNTLDFDELLEDEEREPIDSVLNVSQSSGVSSIGSGRRTSAKRSNRGVAGAVKKDAERQKLKMMNDALDILKNASSPISAATPEPTPIRDEWRLFADLVYLKMMTFSDRTKRLVQREINKILYKAEDGLYDQENFCNGNQTYYSND